MMPGNIRLMDIYISGVSRQLINWVQVIKVTTQVDA